MKSSTSSVVSKPGITSTFHTRSRFRVNLMVLHSSTVTSRTAEWHRQRTHENMPRETWQSGHKPRPPSPSAAYHWWNPALGHGTAALSSLRREREIKEQLGEERPVKSTTQPVRNRTHKPTHMLSRSVVYGLWVCVWTTTSFLCMSQFVCEIFVSLFNHSHIYVTLFGKCMFVQGICLIYLKHGKTSSFSGGWNSNDADSDV